MGKESIRIISDADGFRLIGETPIAVREAAYVLLEKYGVRWFFKHPAWTYTPATLANIGTFDYSHTPQCFWREMAWVGNNLILDGATVGSDWTARNRLFGEKCYFVGESYSSICPPATYWPSHKEYYLPTGEREDLSYPWQLDPDNVDVQALAETYVRGRLATHKHNISSYDALTYGGAPVIPGDGAGFDPPWDCSLNPAVSDWQLITDGVWRLTNSAAVAVKGDYPDRYVTMTPYTWYAGIPDVALNSNIIALITTTFNYTSVTINDQIASFIAKGVKVGIYDYYVGVATKDKPLSSHPKCFCTKIKSLDYFYATGAYDVFSAEATDGYGSLGLVYYALAKKLEKPTLNTQYDIYQDFYDKAFGAASTHMKNYYEHFGDVTIGRVAEGFRDLDAAETDAAGNAGALARIRQMECYQLFLWYYHIKLLASLTLEECQWLYILVCKIRDWYLVDYGNASVTYGEGREWDIRARLIALDMTQAEVVALRDFVAPTAEEISGWMDTALAALIAEEPDAIAYIDPLYLPLEALGDEVNPVLTPLEGGGRAIYFYSAGDQDIDVLVKDSSVLGMIGDFTLYNPYNFPIQTITYPLPATTDWKTLSFHTEAGIAGIYRVQTATAPTHAYYVDIQDHSTGLGIPTGMEAKMTVTTTLYVGDAEQSGYFYVPADTTFIFQLGITTATHITGHIYDPDGNVVQNIDIGVATEFTITTPTDGDAGTWKFTLDQVGIYGAIPIGLKGIAPLMWGNPAKLLIQGDDPAAPEAPAVVGTSQDCRVIVADTSDEYLDRAATELKTALEAMTGETVDIVTSDPGGVAIRLKVGSTTGEPGTDLTKEMARLIAMGRFVDIPKLTFQRSNF